MSIEPPGERVEPEQGAMQKGKALGKSVATGYVRDLVSDDSVELVVVPFPPTGGEKNCGAPHAHREWYRNQVGLGCVRNDGEAGGAGACGEALNRAQIVDRFRGLQQAAAICETDEEAREQNQSDHEIDSDSDFAPSNQ